MSGENSHNINENIFPEILRYAIKALDNEKRQILVSVLARVRDPLKFNNLKDITGIRSNDLAYHLKELEKGNIIEKEAENGEIYYRLSEFGTRLITNIISTIVYRRLRRRTLTLERKIPATYRYEYTSAVLSYRRRTYSEEQVIQTISVSKGW